MKLNISRFFLFAVLAVLTAGFAKAEDTFTIPKDICVPAGTEVYTLEIGIDNADPYTEGQFDLVLPSELELIPYLDEDDEPYFFEHTSRITSKTAVEESNPSDGVYRLLFYSVKATPIKENSGTAFTCQINTKNLPVGAYTIQLTDMELAHVDATVDPKDITATLYITEMALSPSETTLLLNDQSQRLEATLLPEGAPSNLTNLTWSSSDPETVSVEDGVITGLALGEATITATGEGYTASCKVTVVPVMPASITMPETLSILLGEESTLTAEVLPANTTDPTLTWASSDEAVVSVDAEGNIQGLKLGSATITATSVADNAIKAQCVVTVNPVMASAITLSSTSLEVLIGSVTPALEVTFDPENTTDKTLTWSSDNEAVVTVAADGTITAVGVGTANITATTTNDVTAMCTVTVKPIEAVAITLDKTEVSIMVGYTETLTVVFDPTDTTDKTLSWSSDNENVATVDNGVVTAVGLGEATITATTTNGITAQCKVNVTPIEAVAITLSQTEMSLLIGSTSETIEVSFDPEDTTIKTITWSSDNEEVAIVENGVVTAVGLGEATITATTNNGKTATCKVTVLPIEVETVTLSQTEATILVDETLTLRAEITPADATFKTLTWTSSDEKVATVEDGVVTALAVGTVTITATSHNDISAECVITVNPVEATRIELSTSELTISINGTHEPLDVIFTPANTTDKTITWSSSDESVVSIAEDGSFTGLTLGEATITATTVNGKEATCKVTVSPVVATAIELSETELNVLIGSSTPALEVTFTPADTSDKAIKWTSDDESVVTVEKDGTILAVGVGEATITAATSNGITANCSITVNPILAESITLSQTSMTLIIGTAAQEVLSVTFNPEDTTDKSILWSTDNEEVATVVDGLITSVGVGEATITATTTNGVKAECKVTVLPIEVETVTISQTEATILVDETLTLTAEIAPEDATFKTLTWSSSDEKVATVEEGVVTALAVGKVTITATAHNGVKAECVVTVDPVLATEIAFPENEIEVYLGSKFEAPEVTFTPANTTDKTLTWTSSDEAVVGVDVNGTITADGLGEATITATTTNGVKAELIVKVNPVMATAITLSSAELDVFIGSTIPALEVTFDPENTTDKTITWTSSEEAVATVAEDGTITALALGEATITATTVNGKTATCTVTVLPIEAEAITMSQATMSLIIGSTSEALTVEFDPNDTTDKTLTWASSDEEVATVADGVVTAVGVGEATITAKTANGKTATCVVTVLPIEVETITLSQTEATILVDETLTLSATIAPEDATFKTLIWASSNTEVATVEDGVVTALAVGKVIITATATNGVKAECVVTVDPVLATAISLSKTELSVFIGSTTEPLAVTFTPANTTDKTIAWSSSDEAVVAVAQDGTITAIALGTATITATTSNDVKAGCVVTVNPIEAEGIALSKAEATLLLGSTETLTVLFDPENTTDKTVTWSTSDEKIATVEDGVVTAVGLGEATITATTVNGKTASCAVTVLPIEAEAITMSQTTLSLIIGSASEALTVVFDPNDTTDKTLTWSSSDEEVATVADGVVTAVSVGEATITATTANGKTATCVVTVLPIEADSIVLSKTETTLVLGSIETITALFNPEDTTDKTLTWSSSDEEVATVANGVITAVGVGQATVTATTVNGKTAQCVVTVLPIEVEAITLSQTEASILLGQSLTLKATVDPENATYKTLTWSSSDEDVVTVVEGVVTAVGVGEATITATAVNGVKAECVVTVLPIEADSIALSKTETSLVLGSTETLTALFNPEDTTDKTLTWTSSDEEVATVYDGVITAVGVGQATVTATTVNGKTASCVVTVLPIEVESITLSQTEVILEVDEMVVLTATLSPVDATYQNITWTSSDEGVAIVSEDGTVLAVSGGTAVITATADNGVSAECVVTVIYTETVTMELSQYELNLTVGEIAELWVTFIPEDADVEPVVWYSADETVATVVDGVVTAVGVGSTDIFAVSGLLTASCHIVVKNPTSAIENASALTGQVKVIDRTIVVDTDALITVCTSAGAVIYRGYDNTIEVGAAGLYLINVGNKTTKVIIR